MGEGGGGTHVEGLSHGRVRHLEVVEGPHRVRLVDAEEAIVAHDAAHVLLEDVTDRVDVEPCLPLPFLELRDEDLREDRARGG